MSHHTLNPWAWPLAYGFSQGRAVDQPQRLLFCAGQTAVDAEGRVQHAGDIRAQLARCLDNVEAVLREGGMGLADVVRLTIYTTDVDALVPHLGLLAERFGRAGAPPAQTLLGVSRLAFPDLLVELEATAVA